MNRVGLRQNPAATGESLVPFEDALAALGSTAGRAVDYAEDVPLDRIVGSAGRAEDFDAGFRLTNRSLLERWRTVARSMDGPGPMPRVRLTRLGEMYFVVDGHHRISVARSRQQHSIPAQVHWMCTTAYAMACLRAMHLPSKAAEREFLSRIPLPDPVRAELWLDRPRDWMRLADSAEAWAFRAHRDTPLGEPEELAARWWSEEVQPLVHRLRTSGVGVGLRDVEVYAAALFLRDERGHSRWPETAGQHR